MIKITTYTLIGIISTIIIAFVFNHIFGVELQSAALYFILPVGGLYVGIGGASGLFYSYFQNNKPITYRQYIFALLLAVITFYGIYYASYLTSGNHLNTFQQYLELQRSSGEVLIGIRGVVSPTGIPTGNVINTISFYLQLFGALLGSIGIGMYFHTTLDEKMGR